MKRHAIRLEIVFLLVVLTALALASPAPARRLTSTSGESAGASIAVAGSTVHAVWYDNTPGQWEIYYRRSTDDGVSWKATRRLTNSSGAFHPSVAVSGTAVHVVWMSTGFNKNIFYKRSLNGGKTWSRTFSLTADGLNSSSPVIVAEGTEVHVAWTDTPGGRQTLFYRRSLDGGANWRTTKHLRSPKGTALAFPSIAMAGSDVYVAWQEHKAGRSDIFVKRSGNSGRSWKRTRISRILGNAGRAAITAAGSNVDLLWSGNSDGENEIFLVRSLDGGASWLESVQLTPDPGPAGLPAIAVAGSEVHTLYTSFQSGEHKIYFKTSPDGGTSWSEPVNLASGQSHVEFPVVAARGRVVHVAWAGIRSGLKQIYYERIE